LEAGAGFGPGGNRNWSSSDQKVERFGNLDDFLTVNDFEIVLWCVRNLLANNVIRKPFQRDGNGRASILDEHAVVYSRSYSVVHLKSG
jgi:hypothetical protein